MADGLQAAGSAAFQKLPYGMQRIGMPKILPANGQGSSGMRAGVEDGNPVSPVFVKDQTNFNNPDYTPQLLRHEQTHRIQANWPAPLQKMLPPINPSDPYNYGGPEGIAKIGSNPMKLSEEQMAAAEQKMQQLEQNREPIPAPLKKLDQNFQAVPLSVMQPTDPHGKGINTMPRSPGLPAGYDPESGKILQTQDVLPVKTDSGPSDPWAQAAAEYQKSNPGGGAPEQNSSGSNDDWKLWGATGDNAQPETSLTQRVKQGATDLGKGALKGLLNDEAGIGSAIHSIPYIGSKLIPQQGLDTEKAYSQPQGTMQKVGKGVEQAGEFLAPGLGEEGALAKVAEEAPRLMPAARIGYGALTSGLVNKTQGGGFGTGAAAGAAGTGIGEGLKAMAPGIAESAMKIRKLDRSYGKTTGRAILDETTGLRPGTVAESAQNRLNELNPELEKIADSASSRPAPSLRGLLPPPATEISLGEAPGPGEMPGALLDAQRFPSQNVGEARVIRNPRGQILPRAARNVEFPDETGKLPFGRNPKGQILSRTPTRQAWMTGGEGEVPSTPGISGPGVLLRRPEVSPGAFELPTSQPNNIASLSPARGVVGQAMGKAATQNAGKEAGQLQPLADFLHHRFDTGESIPQMVTPRQLLDLRRGFGSEFVHNWNPETMPGVTGTARNTYHALSSELHSAAPETAPIDRRISSLIPVAKRAASTELNADAGQRILGRIGAHTGAATLGGLGAAEGYREKGVPGAILGAVGGIAVPELIASPTGQMALARGLNSTKTLPKLLVGSGLQANR